MTAYPLQNVRLRDWRNIQRADLDLNSGQTLLIGANGQGKSNLIEAVYALATATSFRSRHDDELIRWGESAAYLRGRVESEEGNTTLELGIERERRGKRVKVDEKPVERLADIYGHLRVTLLAPEDLQIVSGSPEHRRRYLDMLIAQLTPSHIGALQAHRRAVKQRNHVLRASGGFATQANGIQLDAWDQQVAEFGAEVMRQRREMASLLFPLAAEKHAALAGETESLEATYRPNVGAEPETEFQSILDSLAEKRGRDIERGTTGTGPHRDDISLRLSGRDAAITASQGQRRTIALALRLAQAQAISERSGQESLLLIDDVVYEMDADRKHRFWEALPDSTQRLVTATHPRYLGQKSTEGLIYHVEHGEIRSA